jgi:solute:Na+ symporter, SSS family
MANLSGAFNLYAGIITKDVYQPLFARDASEHEMLKVGRIATVGVALMMTLLAVLLAVLGTSIFQVMVTFNTVISLAYGPPALLGLVVKKTPHWSGLAAFLTGLTIGSIGSFLYHWGLVTNVVVVIPVSIAVFLMSALFDRADAPQSESREELFDRLNTPIDVEHELKTSADQTARVFRFLSRVTGVVGLLALLLLFSVAPGERMVVIAYAGITLLVSFSMIFIRGTPAVEKTGADADPMIAGVPR